MIRKNKVYQRRLEEIPKEILFVCHGHKERSPTAERIFCGLVHKAGYRIFGIDGFENYEVRIDSAGIRAWEEGRQLTTEISCISDIIFAMDPYIECCLIDEFRQPRNKIINLNIKDQYRTGDLDLIEILNKRLKPYAEKWYPAKR